MEGSKEKPVMVCPFSLACVGVPWTVPGQSQYSVEGLHWHSPREIGIHINRSILGAGMPWSQNCPVFLFCFVLFCFCFFSSIVTAPQVERKR